ncbi:MAG: hypothetical protein KME32_27100 [Mojavia pulchra JT2-VF2]|uniref:Uncharacterized protein n=1 Tax=Mojavia pulchra JT2-VF2 TaxID=287848 RepID=A0A951UJU8_9NOST|nr:hypothetical protein [Mojavia pulchra JT2-VF2]
MSNNDEPENFVGDRSNFNLDKIRIEIPGDQKPTYQERIPFVYNPMG